ncbi:hypothetical protein [Streptomyces litchfieldiae]|uniref:Translation elongation factor EFG/EF2 domain-containing protein n=1 Tax=Streptomyces litchfieldiae TaxID=3075543 RepID=A0ABU2MW19_9ACTN|nr:hypothetical protein [Streptomyces sp. DSM 44938]MDT0345832.1 hypothetical protein [Streptomyces sp. DSM 44938]
MTSVPARPFPPRPLRGVRVLHKKINCAPQFAEITVDFEPAAEGFAFETAADLDVAYEPAADIPGFLTAAAEGIRDQLSFPEHGLLVATRVVLVAARAHPEGSSELAFRIAGALAARSALELAREDGPDGS